MNSHELGPMRMHFPNLSGPGATSVQ